MFQLLVGDIPGDVRAVCATSSPYRYICCGDLLHDLKTSPEIQKAIHGEREIGDLIERGREPISSGQRLGSELIEGIELAPGDGR
jgi:hypothetical protein